MGKDEIRCDFKSMRYEQGWPEPNICTRYMTVYLVISLPYRIDTVFMVLANPTYGLLLRWMPFCGQAFTANTTHPQTREYAPQFFSRPPKYVSCRTTPGIAQPRIHTQATLAPLIMLAVGQTPHITQPRIHTQATLAPPNM